VILLLLAAVLLALLTNTFSPAGIPLLGQWDESEGVVRADPKDGQNTLGLEIEYVEIAKEIYDKGGTLFIDARDNEAFEAGHIRGALSLPPDEFDSRIESILDRYPLEHHIITYCSGRSCEDSHYVAQLLIEFGYEKVSVMMDGFVGWEEKGFPVE
jgi:rhodanese-related sulfurtransferase